MKIRLSLDIKNFDRKPTKKETIRVSNRIAKYQTEISIDEFAKYVTQPYGRSFSVAIFSSSKRSNKTWKSQQVFALDIDSGLTIKDALERCNSLNISPTFIYTTFSSTPQHEKYRIIFVLNEEIDDIRVRNFIQRALMKIFPESDPMTKDAARMMFGGKKIIYSNFDELISLSEIYSALCTVIKTGSNPSRDMMNFCRTVGIDIYNGYPKIVFFNDYTDMPHYNKEDNVYNSMTKKWAGSISNNRVCPKNSHMEYLIFFSSTNTKEYYYEKEKHFDTNFSINKYNGSKKLIRNYPFEELYENCRLYRESIEGKYWLYHNEMFGLMTNLLQIKGGSTKVKKILKSRKEYSEKMDSWNTMQKQIYKANYAPSRCDNYCPFAENCIHGLNMIDQGKLRMGTVQVFGKKKLKTLEEAERELEQIFIDILKKDKNGIYIIKAPTGIGKTKLYVNASKQRNMTIAVPTHSLKEDVSNRLTEKEIKYFAVPQLPDLKPFEKYKIERFYGVGSFKGAHIYLKKLAKNNDNVAKYLEAIKKLKTVRNQTIITTHQRILFEKDFNDTLIIDEDIVLNGLFQIDKMSLNEFAAFYAFLPDKPELKGENKIIDNIYNELINVPENIVQKTPNYFLLYADFIEKLVVENEIISTNVLGFLNSSYYVKTKGLNGDSEIHFIRKRDLPEKKIIILSATINERIAKMVFGENVNFYDIGNVEHKGEILQIVTKSFSRFKVQEDYDGMVNVAKRLIEQYNPRSSIITYKGYFKEIGNIAMHFGDTAGKDSLKGKNITVIGTPHVNPITYLLLSHILGHNVQLDGSKMEYLPVSRDNYRFYFQAYGNDDLLREIQFYMIESELMQAVGRARTLRENCRVLVLSNYPIQGADFIPISLSEITSYKNAS